MWKGVRKVTVGQTLWKDIWSKCITKIWLRKNGDFCALLLNALNHTFMQPNYSNIWVNIKLMLVSITKIMKSTVVCIIHYTETDTLEFPDWTAFLHWKERTERETFTSYTKPKGSVSGRNEGNIAYNYAVWHLECMHTTFYVSQRLKTLCCTLVVVMDLLKKTANQERLHKKESTVDLVKWMGTAYQEWQ